MLAAPSNISPSPRGYRRAAKSSAPSVQRRVASGKKFRTSVEHSYSLRNTKSCVCDKHLIRRSRSVTSLRSSSSPQRPSLAPCWGRRGRRLEQHGHHYETSFGLSIRNLFPRSKPHPRHSGPRPHAITLRPVRETRERRRRPSFCSTRYVDVFVSITSPVPANSRAHSSHRTEVAPQCDTRSPLSIFHPTDMILLCVANRRTR